MNRERFNARFQYECALLNESSAAGRYLRAAKKAKEWHNNPNTYAEKFRLAIREEYKDYPVALKAFDQIDMVLAND